MKSTAQRIREHLVGSAWVTRKEMPAIAEAIVKGAGIESGTPKKAFNAMNPDATDDEKESLVRVCYAVAALLEVAGK